MVVNLPFNRPHLFEFHDQSWCPPSFRAQTQAILTFLWVHRILPFQSRAPYVATADILDGLIRDIEFHDKGKLKVVDCCSGAGGPIPVIERRVNERRKKEGKIPVNFLLSDLHPHLPSWTRSTASSSFTGLSFIPYPVDATHAPQSLTRERHIRTFCLSFHHFNEDGARNVIQDAMRTAEALCIFELQQPDIPTFIMMLTVFPLVYFVTPFTKPSFSVLFFTYVIPVIPFMMMFDGIISAYRTRSLDHVKYLASLASLTLSLEGKDKDVCEWQWTEGRYRHTWPFGTAHWIIGRKERCDGDESEEGDVFS